MTSRTGWLRRDDRRVVRVQGEDRTDYLHRMLSQDIAGLAEGRAADACLLTPKGRLIGVPLVVNVGDALLLDLDAATVEAVVATLERTVITEDVTFVEPEPALRRVTVVGGADMPALEPLAHAASTVGGVEAFVVRRDLGRVPAYELFLVGAPAFEGDVLTPAAWNALRVAERVPAWGAELGPDVMPLEARLGDRAVSFSKGCFPGQEPVAMAHHRGHPARLLVRTALDGAAPAAGADLLLDGRAVGRLTTVADDAALAYLSYGQVEEGRELEVEGGGRATILDAV